jgi:hypothetical protein
MIKKILHITESQMIALKDGHRITVSLSGHTKVEVIPSPDCKNVEVTQSNNPDFKLGDMAVTSIKGIPCGNMRELDKVMGW